MILRKRNRSKSLAPEITTQTLKAQKEKSHLTGWALVFDVTMRKRKLVSSRYHQASMIQCQRRHETGHQAG